MLDRVLERQQAIFIRIGYRHNRYVEHVLNHFLWFEGKALRVESIQTGIQTSIQTSDHASMRTRNLATKP